MEQFLTKAAVDILSERQRQAKVYTPEHDDAQVEGQLSKAAAAYYEKEGLAADTAIEIDGKDSRTPTSVITIGIWNGERYARSSYRRWRWRRGLD